MAAQRAAAVISACIANPDDDEQKENQLTRHHDEETERYRAVHNTAESYAHAAQCRLKRVTEDRDGH